MGTVDIIILICFIPALIQGVRKGFIAQLTALISTIVGAWLSFRFSDTVCDWLKQYIEVSEQMLHIIAFVVIMIIVVLLLNLVGRLITSVVKLVMLGWLDKLLGVVFALLKTSLILGILIILFNTINTNFNIVNEETLKESIFYTPLKEFSYGIFPYFKELMMKQPHIVI